MFIIFSIHQIKLRTGGGGMSRPMRTGCARGRGGGSKIGNILCTYFMDGPLLIKVICFNLPFFLQVSLEPSLAPSLFRRLLNAPAKVCLLIYTKKACMYLYLLSFSLFFLCCTSSEKDISDGRTCLLLMIFQKKSPNTNPNPNPKHLA